MLQRCIAVLFAMLLVGCSRGDTSRTADSANGTVGASAGGDAEEDRVDPESVAAQSLLRELADRDETALEIARMAVTRREQLKVSDDARRMLSERRKESNRLLGMLKAEFRETHKPEITAKEQPLIDSLNGVGMGEFDGAFLTIVARHNQEDAQLIERALPRISPKLRETLSGIRAQRLSEAEALQKQGSEKQKSGR